jgi:uncharacterized membrane protein YjgN (DUF898 family)
MPPAIGLAGLTRTAEVHGAPPDATGASPGGDTRHPLRFGGSGSEYFRIWIVNLLLILVTFSLYYPWAKVRKLRYFYGNTELAGHAFDFHGDPTRMLRGYLLVGALFAAYSMAGQFSPTAALIALVIIAAIWPLLFRASLRFRLAQTSWRGLRFGFDGSSAGAYRALLPAFVPAIVLFGLGAFAGVEDPPEPPASAEGDAPVPGSSMWAAALPLAVMLAVALLVPFLWWMIKRYQHGHFRLGRVRTTLSAGARPFYALFAKASLVGLGSAAVVGLLASLLVAGGVSAALVTGGGRGSTGTIIVLTVVAVMAAYAVVILLVQPYLTSRLQNLVWSRTESAELRFESRLRFRSLLALTLKNWLLVLVTLGLYWPFAAIAMARMRLEAVTVLADGGLDQLVVDQRDPMKDAAGDAAGDVFGIDVGL